MTETPVNPAEPDAVPAATVDELDVHNGEPLRPTALDGNGVERIAGPPVENWKPAQVDPTDEQIARNQDFHAREAARRDQATELLSAPTSEPLAAAQTDYHAELDAAAVPAAQAGTDQTPAEPEDPVEAVAERGAVYQAPDAQGQATAAETAPVAEEGQV